MTCQEIKPGKSYVRKTYLGTCRNRRNPTGTRSSAGVRVRVHEEQQLRAVSSPTYVAKNRDKALAEQSVSAKELLLSVFCAIPPFLSSVPFRSLPAFASYFSF